MRTKYCVDTSVHCINWVRECVLNQLILYLKILNNRIDWQIKEKIHFFFPRALNTREFSAVFLRRPKWWSRFFFLLVTHFPLFFLIINKIGIKTMKILALI